MAPTRNSRTPRRTSDVTRTRLERILELDRLIRDCRHPNCSSFARHWAERIGSGRAIDRKTVLRDIDWLRDMMHAPIAWSAAERGYYYTDPAWNLPAVSLTEGELVSLLLARQMARMYGGTPIHDTLEALFEKISRSLANPVNVDPAYFENLFSFHSHPSRPVDGNVWSALFRALREHRVLRLAYQGLYESETAERDVEPAHLANVDDDWYLVGYCLSSRGWRHFSVSRIAGATVTNRPFSPREEFDPEAYFADRFGKFIAQGGGKPFMVKIRFSAAAAPRILERTWHRRQKIKKGRDGSLELSLPIPSLIEAKRFCLGWGKEAEALEPPELRREMAGETAAMAGRYAGSK